MLEEKVHQLYFEEPCRIEAFYDEGSVSKSEKPAVEAFPSHLQKGQIQEIFKQGMELGLRFTVLYLQLNKEYFNLFM